MKNKFRLYLAYWRRSESAGHPGRYHVGLILSPKEPKNTEGEATIFHAINGIDKKTQEETWRFECRPSMARTARLAGVILLGKVPPNLGVQKITDALQNIHVPTVEEANRTGWRCRHWVLDAIQLLANEGIIPMLPSSAQNLWQIGYSFVEKKTDGNDGYSDEKGRVPSPTCDMKGQEIRSELGPLN